MPSATRGPEPIDAASWEAMLARAELLRAEDTVISGWIRVIELDGEIRVEEETPDRRILLRRFADRAAADRFVDRRLETYDRMWDGCGCRVDYDEA